MAEIKVEKPAASAKRTREELMARLSKNPNVNPETGVPTKNTATPFLDAVNQRMTTPTPMPLREGDMGKGMTAAGPIDQRRSPITGLPVSKLGATPSTGPMTMTGGSFGGGFGGIVTPTSVPNVDEVTGANFSAGLSPVGNALKSSPVGGTARAATPMGNITSLDKSVPTNPYRVSAAGGNEVTGANFSAGLSPVGNALKSSPVVDARVASAPMGNITTGIESPSVDMEAAKALFKRTHGRGGFDPKSKRDQAKMRDIVSLMSNPEAASLTPNQFAMQIYKSQKSRK